MTDQLVRYRVQLPHGADPDRGPGWTDLWIRDSTSDVAVLDEVWVQDAYHCRGTVLEADEFERPQVVDIGACTGIFAALCLQLWPACEVHCYEPDQANFDLLTVNTQKWASRVRLHRQAVGRHGGRVGLAGSHGTGHTVEGDTVEQVSLASILTSGPVAFLKVDVEGAEYDMLDACPTELFRHVDRIACEWHGTREAPWVDDAPRRYGELVAKLGFTHAVSAFGSPDAGGYLYAHRYD